MVCIYSLVEFIYVVEIHGGCMGAALALSVISTVVILR